MVETTVEREERRELGRDGIKKEREKLDVQRGADWNDPAKHGDDQIIEEAIDCS